MLYSLSLFNRYFYSKWVLPFKHESPNTDQASFFRAWRWILFPTGSEQLCRFSTFASYIHCTPSNTNGSIKAWSCTNGSHLSNTIGPTSWASGLCLRSSLSSVNRSSSMDVCSRCSSLSSSSAETKVLPSRECKIAIPFPMLAWS